MEVAVYVCGGTHPIHIKRETDGIGTATSPLREHIVPLTLLYARAVL